MFEALKTKRGAAQAALIASGIIVAWDASRDARWSGTNEIGIGSSPGSYTNMLQIKGGAVAARIENLPRGVLYMAVRYKDERGLSGWSNELVVTNENEPTNAFSFQALDAIQLSQILPQATGAVALSISQTSNMVTLSTSGDTNARVLPLTSAEMPATNWEATAIEPLGVPGELRVTNRGKEFFKGLIMPKY